MLRDLYSSSQIFFSSVWLSLLLKLSMSCFMVFIMFFSSIISVQYFKKNCLYRFAEQLILFTHYFSEFFDLSVCIFLTLEFLENNFLNSFFWQLTGFHFFEVSHWKIIIFHSWCHGFAFSCFSRLCIYTCEFKGAVASFSLLWIDFDGERLSLKLNTEAPAGWGSVSLMSGMPLRQGLLSISFSWNHLLLKLLEFSVVKTAEVLWMAVSASEVKTAGILFFPLFSWGGYFIWSYPCWPQVWCAVSQCRSGAVVGGSGACRATVAHRSWDRDVFFMVGMLVSEGQACAHLLWNQGLHLWDSGQWSWPRVCVCVCVCVWVCVCWGDRQ